MQRSWLKNRGMILWLAVVCYGASAGLAWSAPLVLTEKDSGRTLTVGVGQRLVVDLRLGAGQHVVAPEFNPLILSLVGQSLQSTTGPQGASSRITFSFIVQQRGQTDLVIAVKGSGEKAGQSKALFKVKIVASGGGQNV
jgi:hypothetical protein